MTANLPDPEVRHTAPAAKIGRRPADTFANRLLLTRSLAGHLSIREATDLTGLNREAWRDWERGRRPRDILDVCRRIADALDIDHDWLLFGGALAGPRGLPTKRAADNTHGYPQRHVRPRENRPEGRPSGGQRPAQPQRSEQRRPVRISRPVAA
jgi:transcriptional regulator with XRE-family HTH domain